mmetsp:Transcript_21171/g.65765  ORF Transcript_21171/g.65765 Transcript_21171/m.65765 type:complete len:407 (-) Transcript_21171:793-2013(-)
MQQQLPRDVDGVDATAVMPGGHGSLHRGVKRRERRLPLQPLQLVQPLVSGLVVGPRALEQEPQPDALRRARPHALQLERLPQLRRRRPVGQRRLLQEVLVRVERHRLVQQRRRPPHRLPHAHQQRPARHRRVHEALRHDRHDAPVVQQRAHIGIGERGAAGGRRDGAHRVERDDDAPADDARELAVVPRRDGGDRLEHLGEVGHRRGAVAGAPPVGRQQLHDEQPDAAAHGDAGLRRECGRHAAAVAARVAAGVRGRVRQAVKIAMAAVGRRALVVRRSEDEEALFFVVVVQAAHRRVARHDAPRRRFRELERRRHFSSARRVDTDGGGGDAGAEEAVTVGFGVVRAAERAGVEADGELEAGPRRARPALVRTLTAVFVGRARAAAVGGAAGEARAARASVKATAL